MRTEAVYYAFSDSALREGNYFLSQDGVISQFMSCRFMGEKVSIPPFYQRYSEEMAYPLLPRFPYSDE
jgi:hypothetical protein